jgi:hypothetical protein
MDNLKFYGNWRRILLLGKSSSFDIDEPVEYIELDVHKIGMPIHKFCDDKWNELGFDFDPYSLYIWPVDDKVSALDLADQLNQRFANCARIVRRTPAEAHGLGNNLSLEADGWDDVEDAGN